MTTPNVAEGDTHVEVQRHWHYDRGFYLGIIQIGGCQKPVSVDKNYSLCTVGIRNTQNWLGVSPVSQAAWSKSRNIHF